MKISTFFRNGKVRTNKMLCIFCVTKEVKSCMDEPGRETLNFNSVGLLPTKTPPNNNREGQRELRAELISHKDPHSIASPQNSSKGEKDRFTR